MKTLTTIGIIFVASLALFTFRLGQPTQPVFDEPCYVAGAKALMSGLPDANPEHPPMGKLLIGLGIRAFGDNPFGWRIASAVAGSLSVAGAFLLILSVTGNYEMGVLAALLLVFNNFTFVLARVAMLEIFIIMFVVWALVAWLQKRYVSCGFLLGCAVATKWSALIICVLVFGITLVWGERAKLYHLVLPAVAVYVASFAGRNPIKASIFILNFHKHAAGNPAINSLWYTWLMRMQPERAMDYLTANAAITIVGIAALVVCMYRKEWLMGSLFLGSLLQWAIIGRTFSYYYYYAMAFTFMTLAIPVALRNNPKVFGVRLSVLVAVGAAVGFLILYPKMVALEAPYDCALVCII